MKRELAILALLLPAAAAGAAPAASEPFLAIKPDYKKAQVVPGDFFDPFRQPAAAEANGTRRDPALLSEDAVAAAVNLRGVAGLVLGGASGGRALIGGEVFGPGDALEFSDEKTGAVAALVAGSRVVLRQIRPDALVLEIQAEGESPRAVTCSLRPLWQP